MNASTLVDGRTDEVKCEQTEGDSSVPISEAEFHDLYHTLERWLETSPCDESLRHTRRFLRARQLSEAVLVPWLEEHAGQCDGAVLRCAEAYFTRTPIAWPTVRLDALREARILANGDPTTGHDDGMPLSEEDFHGLGEALEGVDCDGSLRLTYLFLRERQLDEATVVQWLEEHGGGCDCEVLLNVVLG